jgi:signal transduction histidine kinase
VGVEEGLRAPVQKKRPRGKEPAAKTAGPGGTSHTEGNREEPASTTMMPTPPPAAGTGKRCRVRSRLVIAVAVVGAAVLGAGAPAVWSASQDVSDSQRLVDLAERARQTIALAHSLADERDDVTIFIAAGRDSEQGPGLSESRSSRVDRQIREIHAEAPADLRDELDDIAGVRRQALTDQGSALDAHTAYTRVITELRALVDELDRQLPPRAGGSRGLPDLAGAVDQAAATRGLLLAALAVPRAADQGTTTVIGADGFPVAVPAQSTAGDGANDKLRDQLSAAAQQSRVREQAELSEYEEHAPEAGAEKLRATVTGPEVTTAEKYLDRLTDQPTLSDDDLTLIADRVASTLSARVDLLRGVESSLAAAEAERLALLRDDDVTALEAHIALAGLCLLVAVGYAMATARTLTRPLAVLRLGAKRLAADPVAEEPVRFSGRNDEFADAVRSVNTLHAEVVRLHQRAEELGTEHGRLIGHSETTAGERDELRAEIAALTGRLEALRVRAAGTYVDLSLRTLGLIERQLAVIEGLEDKEQDPGRLATLFQLDHLATVIRRHNENLLILAGHEHGHRHLGPVPLVDVMRAAVSEIERYDQVGIQALPRHAQIAGSAAEDTRHLVAELLENATAFSPPDAEVQLSGRLLENGELVLSVQDQGIGMTATRLAELNELLAEPVPSEHQACASKGLGLYVVTRLAARHGIRVQLRQQKQGGIRAVMHLPPSLVTTAVSDTTGRAAPAARLSGLGAEGGPDQQLPDELPHELFDELPVRGAARAAVPGAAPAAERAVPKPTSVEEPTSIKESVELAESIELTKSVDLAAPVEPMEPAGPASAEETSGDSGAFEAERAEGRGQAPGGGTFHSPAAFGAGGGAPGGARGSAPTGSGGERTPQEQEDERRRLAAVLVHGPYAIGPDIHAPVADEPSAPVRPSAGPDPEPSPVPDPLVTAAEQAIRDAESTGSLRVSDRMSQIPGPDASALAADRGRPSRDDWPSDAEDRTSATSRTDEDGRPTATTDTPGEHGAVAYLAGGDADMDAPGAFGLGAPASDTASPRAGAQDAEHDAAYTHDREPAEDAHGPRAEPTAVAFGGLSPRRRSADDNWPAAEQAPVADRPGRDVDQPVPDKGLPKRTPRVVAQAGAPAQEGARKVDPQELRIRLGGFRKGAEEGRRDAEAEIAARTGEDRTGRTPTEDGTVEEARS